MGKEREKNNGGRVGERGVKGNGKGNRVPHLFTPTLTSARTWPCH